ncbi:OTU protein [Cladophialophora chaetospira]|uniref:OTU protein n=1 Tax=Cladophialophora chaetospira TaxID=386627 RepID=A0AA38XCX2_9EURO|nr:OTU protein [Cladophialophora chaetospira]
MEEILARHRKEKKDLQAKITQKKNNATKKTRKGVNDDCDRLERELAEKHQAEIQEMEPQDPTQLSEAVEDLNIDEGTEGVNSGINSGTQNGKSDAVADQSSSDQHHARKPNRQKARLARRAAEQESQAAAAAVEASNLPDLRKQELCAMKEQMKKHGLSETLIRPDGHCLFSACAQSLPPNVVGRDSTAVKKEPYQTVRYAAADFMAEHPDDFQAFMEEPLESYVRKIRDTAEWGGELELQAIARSYKVDINVLRANGRIDRISSGSNNKEDSEPTWLAYYTHSFGLGEHYNALKEVSVTNTDKSTNHIMYGDEATQGCAASRKRTYSVSSALSQLRPS